MAAENKGQEDYAHGRMSIEGSKGTSQTILIFPTPYLFEPNQKRPPEIEPIIRPKPSRLEDDKELIVVEDDCIYRSIIYYRYSSGCKIFR